MMRVSCRLNLLLLAALLITVLVPSTAAARTAAGRFVDRIFRDEAGEHRYVVFVPAGYNPQRRWPVILFLHGAGERDRDGRRQLTVGLGPLVKARAETFPALVVFRRLIDPEYPFCVGRD